MKTSKQRFCIPGSHLGRDTFTPSLTLLLLVTSAAIIFGNGCWRPSPEESTATPDTAVSQPEPRPRPDIVFIIVDTLRADRLGMRRDDVPLMPFLESFSKESWSFTRAASQASWTRPSMASAFTSLYAGVHNQQFGIRMEVVEGQDHTVDALSEDLETMAEYFKEAGYATLGVQANWNMRPLFGVSQGFDRYEMMTSGQNATYITDLCLEMAKDTSSPFFLYVHYIEPHAPYAPPEHYKNLFHSIPEITDTDRELLATYATGYYPDKVRWDLQFRETPPDPQFSEAGKKYVEIMYDAEVRFADDEVGRLIQGIRASHPGAIIVFSADHGEELWEHGSVGHGKTVYNEVLHVPLIFSFPGELPRTVDTRVELIDILPTLAAKIGLPSRDWWQGHSLLENTTAGSPSPVYGETRTSIREANVYLLSVMHDNLKLIMDVPGNKHWLYHLDSDPGELTPVTDTAQNNMLTLLLKQYVENNEAHPLHASPTVTNVVDQETRDILKSQGYF